MLYEVITDHDLERGRIYPALSRIREVSAKIAYEVASLAYARGYADAAEPDNLMDEIRKYMYQPIYPHYA